MEIKLTILLLKGSVGTQLQHQIHGQVLTWEQIRNPHECKK